MKKLGFAAALLFVGFTAPMPGARRALANSQPCEAQNIGCFPDLPGAWQTIEPHGADAAGLSAAQRAFLSKMETVATLMHAAKVFNPPIGFKAEAHIDLPGSGCGDQKDCAAPMPGRIWLMFLSFVKSPNGEPGIDHEVLKDAEFMFNDPGSLWDGDGALKFPDGRVAAYAPERWGEVAGRTLYINQRRGSLYMFLTQGSRPLWIPVTREQYLTELLREREAEAAQSMREFEEDEARSIQEEKTATADLTPQQRAIYEQAAKQQRAALEQSRAAFLKHKDDLVAPLRAQLQNMSAAERASQAWVDRNHGPLVPAESQDARALVAYNPDYFDRSRPRTDIQLITISLGFGTPEDKVGPPFEYATDVSKARLWEFVRELDWQKFAAMMN